MRHVRPVAWAGAEKEMAELTMLTHHYVYVYIYIQCAYVIYIFLYICIHTYIYIYILVYSYRSIFHNPIISHRNIFIK